jgi:hypothetical protein
MAKPKTTNPSVDLRKPAAKAGLHPVTTINRPIKQVPLAPRRPAKG